MSVSATATSSSLSAGRATIAKGRVFSVWPRPYPKGSRKQGALVSIHRYYAAQHSTFYKRIPACATRSEICSLWTTRKTFFFSLFFDPCRGHGGRVMDATSCLGTKKALKASAGIETIKVSCGGLLLCSTRPQMFLEGTLTPPPTRTRFKHLNKLI